MPAGAPYNRRMSAFDVCIRGSGAVAMAAALALSRQGLSVAWTGRHAHAATAPDVRTYALNAASVGMNLSLQWHFRTRRVAGTVAPDGRARRPCQPAWLPADWPVP